jgi:hypothetical protein
MLVVASVAFAQTNKFAVDPAPVESTKFSILDDEKISTLPREDQDKLRQLQEVSSLSVAVWYPTFRGYRIDWCLEFSSPSNCGRKAATISCKIFGYTQTIGYAMDENYGLTYVLADDVLCNAGFCDAFRWIVCQ